MTAGRILLTVGRAVLVLLATALIAAAVHGDWVPLAMVAIGWGGALKASQKEKP
jgi:hypothetical protein